jgi:D-alanine transaminase
MMQKAFINGDYLEVADAKISIFDRGFLFGDSVYEVLPVYQGRPLFVTQHLQRLKSGLDKIKIDWPDYDWHELINRLIIGNGGGDLQVYIQVTRGNQGIRKHDIPASLPPTVVAFTIHNSFPSTKDKEKGIKAKLLEDIRWMRCDIKTTSLLANILLNDEALSSGYQTSIISRQGIITESSTANVFIVNAQGILKTPPLTEFCLPGITRQITLELMNQLGWNCKEEEFGVDELLDAKEVWITSTTKEIMPVIQIDDTVVNKGIIGPYWHTINKSYTELVESL